jgi:hypothetical protein
MKLNFFIPGREPISVATKRKLDVDSGDGSKRISGVIEWSKERKQYVCNVDGIRYPLTKESFDTYGHPNIWSTFLDEHGCNIRIVRQGLDKCNRRKGFLPFKFGHCVYGKIVNRFNVDCFDVRVNIATVTGDYGDSLTGAWNELKHLRAISQKFIASGD